jgi:hypothetical protein
MAQLAMSTRDGPMPASRDSCHNFIRYMATTRPSAVIAAPGPGSDEYHMTNLRQALPYDAAVLGATVPWHSVAKAVARCRRAGWDAKSAPSKAWAMAFAPAHRDTDNDAFNKQHPLECERCMTRITLAVSGAAGQPSLQSYRDPYRVTIGSRKIQVQYKHRPPRSDAAVAPLPVQPRLE